MLDIHIIYIKRDILYTIYTDILIYILLLLKK